MNQSMITAERAQAILLCYGGCPSAWPQHERAALEILLSRSQALRALQKQALSVDEFMGFVEPETELFDRQTALCAERILADLPRQHRPVVASGYQQNSLMEWWEKAKTACRIPGRSAYWFAGLATIFILLIDTAPSERQTVQDFSVSEYMAFYMDADEPDEEVESQEAMDMLAFLEPQLQDEDDVF